MRGLTGGPASGKRADMADPCLESLPLAHRLALSYAPAAARGPTLALLALEARLAGIVRAGGEPVLAQIKLAWWRDRLGEPLASWPQGEPLLALLACWPGDPAGLVPVVDGWEALLADTLDAPAHAQGRAAGWGALAGGLGCADPARAAQGWALADLALHLADGAEREQALALARALDWHAPRLPRALRPLAVLHGLAGRALRRGAGELLDGPGALFAALRLGIAGR